ncbi:CYFA0S01e02278g1_1 [Cyberlindnera fabianii]|uniref:CYFA0S01e02278g1_1 n=1 Tax=Cyberlindnera fabianii TaxID=36022 RepID=A0A061AG41_CYBFA|nr:CYFA0S01e02278g1_1 [Cyberlindnera fabianii]
MDADVPGILTTLRTEANPQLESLFLAFEDLYDRKLWHQLTKTLEVFYKTPSSTGVRMRLYKNFITLFKYKINQLKHVEFLLASLVEVKEASECKGYLLELKEELKKQDKIDKEQALLFLDIEIARCKLHLKQEVEARDDLDKIDKSFAQIDAVDLKLNQSYFSTNSEYYKVKSDYNNFYYQSLLYLSTVQLDDLQLIDQQRLAYDLSISALLADKIYNFGELLTHPILQTLKGGEYQWIIDLLNSLNSGDIDAFSKNLHHLEKNTLLKTSESFLKQKICLMTLVELVFAKSIRVISFKDVSVATLLSIGEVEHLVMRALSLGLLKGSIDQISQTISINWVQPRIINQTQIANMKQKLVAWDANVSKLGTFMEQNGKEIWIE